MAHLWAIYSEPLQQEAGRRWLAEMRPNKKEEKELSIQQQTEDIWCEGRQFPTCGFSPKAL